MKERVYVESSVISYLASKPANDLIIKARQKITHDWWKNNRTNYELCVSSLVEEEISSGDTEAAKTRISVIANLPHLFVSDTAINIAQSLITGGAVPPGSEQDALHIATAAAQGADYILTWNFKHMNNAKIKSKIRYILEELGYNCPQICSPEELN